jgi:hypothetical protein
MTLDRRLARIEESLSPTQLVLRWLGEAHAFGDVPAYTEAVLAKDPPELPLDRLAQEAARGARSATRGKRPEIVDAAVRTALRETVFRFELVMRINVTAHDLLDREALIAAALSAHVSLLVSADQKIRRADPTYTERFITCRDLLISRLTELQAAGEARAIVEGRYLDGHPALFPELAKAWQGQCRESGVIADMAVRLAEFDDVPPDAPPDPESLSGRAAQLVADLVEPAKVEALDKLGEGSRAFDIATVWVRSKLSPALHRYTTSRHDESIVIVGAQPQVEPD